MAKKSKGRKGAAKDKPGTTGKALAAAVPEPATVMKILEIRALWGPNYFSRYPVIYMLLDIGELEQRPSSKVPGFTERLQRMMPTLYEHRCSPGCKGGFLSRVREGTWAGHIVEHVAIELQCLVNMPVGFGQTRESTKKGVYTVVYRFRDDEVGIAAGKAAVEIVEALFTGKKVDFPALIDDLKQVREANAFGPSTHSLVKEAQSRGIPVMRLNKASYVQLGHGVHQRRMQATMVDSTSAIGVEIADYKQQTKDILDEAGIPVPKGEEVSSLREAIDAASYVGYPVAVKPLIGHHGKGITALVRNEKELRVAYKIARKLHDQVVVERHLVGKDHRILVIANRFVAAARREPASITGDGRSSIKQLIRTVNADPRRGVGHENLLTRIEVDHETRRILKQNNLTLESVLKKGRVFHLKSTANLSTGGASIDVTDEVHPEVRKMAERVSKLIDINIMGIDVVAPDLKRPIELSGGGIVEVNAAPGFRMHVAPFEGTPRNVSKHVIDMLFPPGARFTIPIVAVTGTNGKTTTVRLINHILSYAGRRVGMCCTDGVYIENTLVQRGDYSGPAGTKFVLREPTVDHAVLEVARGSILRRGLGYDESDVGVMLNVSSDHLGEGNINTLDELADLKGIVVETVRPGGMAVLNADDPRVLKFKDTIKARSILFSMDPFNPALEEHVRQGGTVVTLEHNNVVIKRPDMDFIVVSVNAIPITYHGLAHFNVMNVLAAVSAAHALELDNRLIQAGLVTFNPSVGQLPGRMNIMSVGEVKVMVDYGHNVSAVRAMAQILPHLAKGKKINVGNGTGNRRDEDLKEFGRTLAGIYDVIFLSDSDPRKRKAGETANMVARGVVEAGFSPNKVKIFPSEMAAVDAALGIANPGDIVVIQADDVQAVIKYVMSRKGSTGMY